MTTNKLYDLFHIVDSAIAGWMAEYGLLILRLSLGAVFLWFGALKLVPGASPEEELIRQTLPLIDGPLLLPALALWEIAIGIGLLTAQFLRLTLLLLYLLLPGTILPLIMLPEITWTRFPYALSLEGQYIVKNVVLIGSALVLGATVRGGGLVVEPHEAP